MKRNPAVILLSVCIFLVIVGRILLTAVRFIDPDEFAYLHWTYLLSIGKVPYRDFFLYHIPLFQILMIPIYLLPYSSFLVYLARFWEFLIYGLTVFLLARLTVTFSKSKTVLLMTILIFLIFPMTLDKTIDIRPDILMILFFLASLVLAFRQQLETKHIVFIGLTFSLSLITFPKIIFAFPALVTVLFLKHKPALFKIKTWEMLAVSGALPILLFLLYLFATGTLARAVELITQGAWAVNAGKIPFSPWLALSPWPVVYVGSEGVSLPWLVNTAVWILAIPGLLLLWKSNRTAGVFLSVFYAFGIFFLFAFPAPYTQYFLPLSVFASFLAALTLDSTAGLLDAAVKTSFPGPSTLLITGAGILLIASFYIQFRERFVSTNEEQMTVIDTLLAISGPDETVYDMIGSYVFRPDGYVICCHPYAEFVDKLKTKPPGLPESLVANKTKFVVLDRTGQAFWKPIPGDLLFLFKHYVESPHKKIYVLGAKFFCTSGSCTQVNINNQPVVAGSNAFDIIVGEQYLAETVPPDQIVYVNGQKLGATPVTFTPGVYSFSVPPNVTQFRVRLAR